MADYILLFRGFWKALFDLPKMRKWMNEGKLNKYTPVQFTKG